MSEGKGTTMATSYKTINDVVGDYVLPTLGDWEKFYNVVDIAYEISYYPTIREADYVGFDRSCRILKDVHDPDSEFFDADMFWDVAEDNRKVTDWPLFSSIDDVVEQYVIPMLGAYADDFDVVGIAKAITFYDRGYRKGVVMSSQAGFRLIPSIFFGDVGVDGKDYWQIADSYAKGN